MTENVKHTLEQLAGQAVRLRNETDLEGTPGQIRLHLAGFLEGPVESEEWTIRMNETPLGTSRVGFTVDKVESIYTQPSGTVEITLRG